jgi:hypothetical protein
MTDLCEIPFESVTDLCINQKAIIYRVSKEDGLIRVKTLKDKEFNKYKFELIKWLKKRPDPEDRVMRFETMDNGVWSYDKEQRLVEARKTREEKRAELNDEIWLKQELKKRGIK